MFINLDMPSARNGVKPETGLANAHPTTQRATAGSTSNLGFYPFRLALTFFPLPFSSGFGQHHACVPEVAHARAAHVQLHEFLHVLSVRQHRQGSNCCQPETGGLRMPLGRFLKA